MPINLLTWLHLIAMAFFVGGQLVLAVAIVPVLRGVNDGEPMRAVARRFGYGTLVALGVLLITGMAMATHLKLGSAWQLHAKLGLFVLLGVLILIHMKKPKLHALDALIFIGSLVAVWLGVSLAS
ncbi:MAG: hypothetical protein WCO96_06660 [Actinomycetes bacterium]